MKCEKSSVAVPRVSDYAVGLQSHPFQCLACFFLFFFFFCAFCASSVLRWDSSPGSKMAAGSEASTLSSQQFQHFWQESCVKSPWPRLANELIHEESQGTIISSYPELSYVPTSHPSHKQVGMRKWEKVAQWIKIHLPTQETWVFDLWPQKIP